MGYTIGYILIGICCFYLIRNFYVGSVMFPLGKRIVDTYNSSMKRTYLHIHPVYRNYYLLVLNPFLWRFLDIYRNDEDGRKIKVLWKEFSELQANLRNMK